MSDDACLDQLIFSEGFVRELAVNDEPWKRKIVFVRPKTKESLHDWIELFLGLDFPDAIVDPLSNSSPMDMIWETYNAAHLNNDPEFHRILFYASRDSFKTLASAVLEILMIALLKRDVAHIAAILDQSRKAKQYAKSFFGKPILCEYVTGSSDRHTEFTHPDGTVNTLQIMVMTLQGTNYEHTSYVSLDELDVVRNTEAYTELAYVASPRGELLPITLLTSSRKWSFGPVQREIDNADRTGLRVRHWNILDVTAHCPDNRCLPTLPKIPIYRSDQTLQSVSEQDFMALNPENSKHYVRDEGFVGCLQNCRIFAACRMRLRTHQTSRSLLLKPIWHVQNLLRSASLEKNKAQLLCWKPSAEGLVYTTLDKERHRKTPAQIAEMIDGNSRPPTFGKMDLIAFVAQKVKEGALSLHAGVDWGFTHNYAFVLGVLDGQKRLFILECFSMPGLELDQVIQLTQALLIPYGGHGVPLLYPDNAYPAYIKTFRKKGFRCKDFKKDVQGGIEAVRYGLMDSMGEIRIFFLDGDDGIALLWTRLNQYHWMLDAAGKPTDQPDEEDDDECDGIRYLCQNIYTHAKGIVVSTQTTKKEQIMGQLPMPLLQPTYENYLSKVIRDTLAEKGGSAGVAKGQKGSLVWSIGDDAAETVDPISILRVLGKKDPTQS